MNNQAGSKFYQIIVAGAGPVGLFLGCCLHHYGLSFVILERRRETRGTARAIGVHPPALELFDRLAISERLLVRGIRVQSGKAFSGQKLLGEVSFAAGQPPYNFVLNVPQYETEKMLEEYLNTAAPGSIRRDVQIDHVEERDGRVHVHTRIGGPTVTEFTGAYIVGCDGMNSVVRRKAGIDFEGGLQDDTFIMGDFTDKGTLGAEARIFLDEEGFIESFPLPGGQRRWVMQTHTQLSEPDAVAFEKAIRDRAGEDLAGCQTSLLSAFSVHSYTASSFVKGRMVLAGDAAHVMTPIGGQGTNLGWLDAVDVSGALYRIAQSKIPAQPELSAYNEKARNRAQKAIKRHEFFMALGRRNSLPFLRRMALSANFKMSSTRLAEDFFAMRDL
jgi:2-polyprenyl-6-methoxyphenol hydroxylase-like FAD-dependent oxidoreductase